MASCHDKFTIDYRASTIVSTPSREGYYPRKFRFPRVCPANYSSPALPRYTLSSTVYVSNWKKKFLKCNWTPDLKDGRTILPLGSNAKGCFWTYIICCWQFCTVGVRWKTDTERHAKANMTRQRTQRRNKLSSGSTNLMANSITIMEGNIAMCST